MTRQIQDQTFKKMLDSISPTSQTTKKLCVRLGYDANDLVYKSMDEFSSFSPEMQVKKYEHYKNRVLKIVNEILTSKSRHKLDQSIKQITLTQIQDKESNSESPQSSVSISMRKDKQWQSRQKVLQNLIFQQLQEEKKHVEYLKKQQKREVESQINQLKKSNSQFRVKQQNNNIIKKQNEQEEERRNQYFLTAIENDSRIQEQKSSRFRIKDQKDTHSERAYSKRQQKVIDEEKDISERLQTIYQKGNSIFNVENQAKQKVDMFRNDLKSYFAQKHNQMLNKKERRNQLLESQQQTYINEQIEKMKRFSDKKSQIMSEEKKFIEEKKQKYQQMQSKCLKNVDQLNYRFQEGYNQTYQQLIEKQTKVVNNKQVLLEQKSLLLKDKFSLRLEDIEFNRAHALRLKQNSESKLLQSHKDAKSQQSNRTMDTLRLKNQLIQKESENQIWEKAKQAASLFTNPIEYDQFIEQQQQILLKKKKHLDQKFASAVSLIKEILPQNEANYLLMPPENKDLKLQQSRAKTSK